DGPEAVLTDDLLATLRGRKAELLVLLAGGQAQASALVVDEGGLALLATTERIRLYRHRYHPADDSQDARENIAMHDSALVDTPIVEVTLYDGRRLRIPQQSTPERWTAPF